MNWNMHVIPDISWFQSFRTSEIPKINPEFNPLNQPRYLPPTISYNTQTLIYNHIRYVCLIC